MARTIQQIYDAIIAEKETLTTLNELQPNTDNAQTLLSDLTSSSKVAKWRLMFWVVAAAIYLHEVVFDKHKAEVEAIADNLITGTARWYQEQSLLYQHGDALDFVNNKYVYSPINEANQIIKRAAALEVGGIVRIKVAKLDSNSLPTALSSAEKTGFSTYVGQIKFAGTNVSITSNAADLLKIEYDIVYDPLVLDSTGQLIAESGTYPVVDAINTFIQNLPFNGVLNLTALTDAIQGAKGVVDPVLNSAEAKYGSLAYSTINKNYTADAGHMVIDPANPLSNTLTYIANV